ncbi:hypothetical protein BJV82DRAFT_586773 [Fennellomyces sp. T-0311]|nr:hypothetical protein BJV82DRAFT_586773 [Fennellomyces sp. T-0311]
MTMQVDQYDLATVVNKDDFCKAVELQTCQVEGRSLVAKRPLLPGDIVLVEQPKLRYLLEPYCRSSLSPCYTKQLWTALNDIVQSPEFCPGVPAAMLAYLQLKDRSQYDFFYYPESTDHPTVKLITNAAHTAVHTLPEFKSLDADDMTRFILKIYGNAHTVSFQHDRTQRTHSRRKERRKLYETKWGKPYSFREEAPSQQRSMICLMSWGSKFAHSCAPNLFLQYEPSQNVMVFRAVRPLNPGDVLSFSYLPEDDMSLGGLVCGTTVLRQAKLQTFKFFDCACTRCADYDWSRGQDVEGCDVWYRSGEWVCRDCKVEPKVTFIGEREEHVQQITLAFAGLAHGLKPVDEDSLRMIEPYLINLLESTDAPRVPRNHWTYGSIHAVLATYHLRLFPQFFGKGLAERFDMPVKGLSEAATYIQFLDNHIWTCPDPSKPGNPMAAFFAGWRIVAIVMDSLVQGTQRTIVIRSQTQTDDSDEEDDIQTSVELVPIPDEWKQPIQKIINIIQSRWMPLVTQVFSQRQSPVVEDMIQRMNEFIDRVEKVSAL